MNKIISLSIAMLTSAMLLFSCGPAAENREAMLARAKVFQDSIANSIRASIAEAESPANMPTITNSPAPTPSAPAK